MPAYRAAVDGRPDLSMIVYPPLDARTAKRICAAVGEHRLMGAAVSGL